MFGKVFLALLLTVIAGCMGRASRRPDEILSYRSRLRDNGYNFEYRTSGGLSREETGVFRYKGDRKEPLLHVRGSYSYLDSNERKITVHYEAGEQGTKTRGDIIPPLKYEAIQPLSPVTEAGAIIPPFLPPVPQNETIELLIGGTVIGTLVGGGLG